VLNGNENPDIDLRFDYEFCRAYFGFVDQRLSDMRFTSAGNAMSILSQLFAIRYSGYDRVGFF